MMKLNEKYIKLSPDNRLYNFNLPVIALTGGIATGKSTVTKLLEGRGLKLIDADQLVKSIYNTEEARAFIRTHYPEAFSHSEILFPKLRELVFSNPEIKKNIESFIYTRLPDAFRKRSSEITGQNFYLYDVPLLFERGLDKLVDLKIVVYAPAGIQLARIMDRDGSKEEIAKKIIDQQMDIEEKKEKADFIINNSGTLTELAAEVDQLLLQILS